MSMVVTSKTFLHFRVNNKDANPVITRATGPSVMSKLRSSCLRGVAWKALRKVTVTLWRGAESAAMLGRLRELSVHIFEDEGERVTWRPLWTVLMRQLVADWLVVRKGRRAPARSPRWCAEDGRLRTACWDQ